ncbi:hypothetical protein GCM10009657_18150 [Oryzihumus leptocrescens]
MQLKTSPVAPMSTVASVAKAIQVQSGVTPQAIGDYTAQDVSGAITWLTEYLARIHGDPNWLCSTPAAPSPTKAVSAPALVKTFAGKDGQKYLSLLEPRFPSFKKACDGATWVAPGVVVGPQRMTVAKDSTATSLIDVDYRGAFGYRLRNADGSDVLHRANVRVDYVLYRSDAGWQLWWTGDYYASTGWGWPDGVPVPAGYGATAKISPVSGSDVQSLAAVQRATRTTLDAPGADWSLRWSFTDPSTGKPSGFTYGGQVALAQGQASLRDVATPRDTEVIYDHGSVDLTRIDGSISAIPGETIPKHPVWMEQNPTRQSPDWSQESDTSPFVNLALVDLATSAAKRECSSVQTTGGAKACYDVRTPSSSAAYSGGIGTSFGWAALVRGHWYVETSVGVDAAGRIVTLDRTVMQPVLAGAPVRSQSVATLSHYTNVAPVIAARPSENLIAKDGTYSQG